MYSDIWINDSSVHKASPIVLITNNVDIIKSRFLISREVQSNE